jgi:(2Fe-2S) ferredoxin
MAIKDLSKVQKCFLICNGGSCLKKEADQITVSIRKNIQKNNMTDEIHTIRTKCVGRCDDAPVLISLPTNEWFKCLENNNIDVFTNQLLFDCRLKENKFLFKLVG